MTFRGTGGAMYMSEDTNMFKRSLRTMALAWRRVTRPRRGSAGQGLLPHQAEFWAIVFGLGLCVALLIAWFDADVIAWKRQQFPTGSPVVGVFATITHLGTSGWILVITGLIGVGLSVTRWSMVPRPQRLRRVALYSDVNFIFFTVAISGILANLVKNTIGRARPKLLNEFGAHHFDFAAFDSVYASFPSGHSTTTGSLFMALVLLMPRWSAIWFVLAMLGGVSRVVVDAHYPSDVVAGLAFGAAFVLFLARWLAQRGTMFSFDTSWIPRRNRI